MVGTSFEALCEANTMKAESKKLKPESYQLTADSFILWADSKKRKAQACKLQHDYLESRGYMAGPKQAGLN